MGMQENPESLEINACSAQSDPHPVRPTPVLLSETQTQYFDTPLIQGQSRALPGVSKLKGTQRCQDQAHLITQACTNAADGTTIDGHRAIGGMRKMKLFKISSPGHLSNWHS
eukprot:1154761-Pelagomonas_calceolata.AAC.1